MNLNEVIELIREKWVEFNDAQSSNFKDFLKDNLTTPKRGLLEFIGVYVVYEGSTPIYIGSAGKGKHPLKYRIADLFAYAPKSKRSPYYHTMTKKLVEKYKMFKSIEVRKHYVENCSFKYIKTDSIDQARMLEQAFIILLGHPKYNE
jgi:hypothetical protein